MLPSNDSNKKVTVDEGHVVVISGRKMFVRPDGTLEPMDKKRKEFAAANMRMQQEMAKMQNRNQNIDLSKIVAGNGRE